MKLTVRFAVDIGELLPTAVDPYHDCIVPDSAGVQVADSIVRFRPGHHDAISLG